MKFSIIIIGISLFAYSCRDKRRNPAMRGIEVLPHFTFISLDSSRKMTSEEIPTGRPCVLFYFDPNCVHCQKETDSIIVYQAMMKHILFYFLTNEDLKIADSFYQHYQLARFNNIFVGGDYQYSFFNAFLPSSVPYIAVYNPDRTLAKVFNGDVDIRSLIRLTITAKHKELSYAH